MEMPMKQRYDTYLCRKSRKAGATSFGAVEAIASADRGVMSGMYLSRLKLDYIFPSLTVLTSSDVLHLSFASGTG